MTPLHQGLLLPILKRYADVGVLWKKRNCGGKIKELNLKEKNSICANWIE
jgi:hypothetical protein